MAESPTSPLLEMEGIYKRFGGVQALKGVNFDLRQGEVHALVGENGAGKSTLIKILSGAYQPDAGTVRLEGRTVAIADPRLARALGIATIYQETSLYPDLSVLENLFIGHQPRRGGGRAGPGQRAAGDPVQDPLDHRHLGHPLDLPGSFDLLHQGGLDLSAS